MPRPNWGFQADRAKQEILYERANNVTLICKVEPEITLRGRGKDIYLYICYLLIE